MLREIKYNYVKISTNLVSGHVLILNYYRLNFGPILQSLIAQP